jgi:hypothetical protein
MIVSHLVKRQKQQLVLSMCVGQFGAAARLEIMMPVNLLRTRLTHQFDISAAEFLRVAGGWIASVTGILAISLLLRSFG